MSDEGYVYQHGFLPYIWYGKDSGQHGMNTTSDELHVCWKSDARGAPDNWIRLKSSISTSYVMRILQIDNDDYGFLPELESFWPPYGTTIATENTTEIIFNFHDEEVFPAKSGATPGKLRIHRGAVKSDGTIGIAKDADVLWESTTFDDTTADDKFKQGDVECSLAGKCIIHLSGSSRLSAGEIYYLSFYTHSFKNSKGYYLFGNTATTDTILYSHMFQCRSFDIVSSDQIINGNSFEMEGVNLLSITAGAMLDQNDILDATFKTKAIKMSLRLANSTSCSSSLLPSGSVHIADVTQTSIVVNNLDLKNCYQGDVYADFTLVRGLRESSSSWSHIKYEYLKNVKIGSIGCDSSCRHCSGPLATQCILCADTSMILNDGECIATCPSEKPYVQSSSVVYSLALVSYKYCTTD